MCLNVCTHCKCTHCCVLLYSQAIIIVIEGSLIDKGGTAPLCTMLVRSLDQSKPILSYLAICLEEMVAYTMNSQYLLRMHEFLKMHQ